MNFYLLVEFIFFICSFFSFYSFFFLFKILLCILEVLILECENNKVDNIEMMNANFGRREKKIGK